MIQLTAAIMTLSIAPLLAQVSPVFDLSPTAQTREALHILGPVLTMRESVAISSSSLPLPARFARPHVERILRFDDQGRLAMVTTYTFNKVNDSYVYGYDDEGRMIEYLSFEQEDTPPQRAEFQYDKEGRLVRQVYTNIEGQRQTRRTQYSSSGDTEMVLMRNRDEEVAIAKRMMPEEDGGWRVMSFVSDADEPVLIKVERMNQDGQALASIWYDAAQEVTGRSQAMYDDDGRMLMLKVLDGSDKLLRSETWTYDQLGRPQTYHRDEGEKATHTAYTYELDEAGNWVKRTALTQITDKSDVSNQIGQEEVITFREFEYGQD
ncbi:MAG: hypothetical protein P8J86_03450 [Phycisphaerales bacterium]|nr:hypothetical protein [Phycisphaerales bacterium]